MNQQNAENTIRIPAVSDAQVIQLFGRLVELSEDPNAAFSVRAYTQELGSARSANEFFDAHKGEKWKSSRRITFAHGAAGHGVVVQYRRGVTTWAQGTQRLEPSQWENEFFIQWNENVGHPPPGHLLRIGSELDALRAKSAELDGSGPIEIRDLLATQIGSLADLQVQIVKEAEEARQRRERELDERRAKQDEEVADLKAKIDEAAAVDRAQLQERQAALDAARKELDDRGHMHARRELRAQITEDLKARLQKPGVSASTQLQRAWIFMGGLALLAAFGFLAWQTSVELNLVVSSGKGGANVLTYMLMGRFAIAAAGVAGLGWYLLGWARNLHDTDLQTDRDLERYRYDLDRASWAIETILEAQAKEGGREGGVVPDEWILGATHGLFAKSDTKSDDHAAMEALGSLLNFAAEAELGPNGPKLKLTKRGIAKLRKSGYVAGE